MKKIYASEWAEWEKQRRSNFFNSLSGFKSVNLIGTMPAAYAPTNLAVFSNIVHVGASPALIGFINRPRAAGGHTLSNIEKNPFYTLNLVTSNLVGAAHQTSAKYAEGESEFEKTGLNAEWHDQFLAPFVKESQIKYGLKLEQIIPIALNGTFLVIGSVQLVILPADLLQTDGFLPLEKAETLASLGNDAYYKTTLLERLPYAKAKK